MVDATEKEALWPHADVLAVTFGTSSRLGANARRLIGCMAWRSNRYTSEGRRSAGGLAADCGWKDRRMVQLTMPEVEASGIVKRLPSASGAMHWRINARALAREAEYVRAAEHDAKELRTANQDRTAQGSVEAGGTCAPGGEDGPGVNEVRSAKELRTANQDRRSAKDVRTGCEVGSQGCEAGSHDPSSLPGSSSGSLSSESPPVSPPVGGTTAQRSGSVPGTEGERSGNGELQLTGEPEKKPKTRKGRKANRKATEDERTTCKRILAIWTKAGCPGLKAEPDDALCIAFAEAHATKPAPNYWQVVAGSARALHDAQRADGRNVWPPFARLVTKDKHGRAIHRALFEGEYACPVTPAAVPLSRPSKVYDPSKDELWKHKPAPPSPAFLKFMEQSEAGGRA